MNYLSGLNAAQLGAVQHKRGPAIVDAGPGSGKTKTISMRIRHLIEEKVPSGQIMALSFTRKSTFELAERVSRLTEAKVKISTFHSWASQTLKFAGFNERTFSPEQGEAESFFLNETGDEKHARRVMTAIDKAKNSLFLSPQSWLTSDFAASLEEEDRNSIFKIWQKYQHFCRRERKIDFTDILIKFYLEWRKELSGGKSGKITHSTKLINHLMVDEFQDTNLLQLKLVKLWAMRPETGNWMVNGYPASLLVCGDADQSIYAFRGAEPKIFLDFPQHFPGTTTFFLGENYRSRANIVRHAISVISNNQERTEKVVKPMRKGEESPVRIFAGDSLQEEAQWVAQEVERLKKEGQYEIAILARHNDILKYFHQTLRTKGIATRSEDFLKLPELETVRNLLKLAVDITHSATEKAVPLKNKEYEAALKRAYFVARRHKISLFEALASDPVMNDFIEIVRVISSQISNRRYANALAEALTFAGLLKPALCLAGEDPAGQFARLETIRNFIAKAKTIHFTDEGLGLNALLALLEDDSSVNSPVTVSTMHGSKGCEWKTVFVVGLNSENFPGAEPDELEEERRLYYVAVTRAKDTLALTGNRNSLCPFIGEMVMPDLQWSVTQ